MTDNAERWRNVAQAAQWLAEGREVEIFNQTTNRWESLPEKAGALTVSWQYRIKPEPPKPREFTIPTHPQSGLLWDDYRRVYGTPVWVRVREVIE